MISPAGSLHDVHEVTYTRSRNADAGRPPEYVSTRSTEYAGTEFLELAASQRRVEAALLRITGMLADMRDEMRDAQGIARDGGGRQSVSSPTPDPRETQRLSLISSAVSALPSSPHRMASKDSNYGPMFSEMGETTGMTIRRSVAMSVPGLALPAHWPACLRIRENQVVPELDEIDVASVSSISGNSVKLLPSSESPDDDERLRRAEERALLLHAIVAMIGFVVLFHDLTIIPYRLAWDLPFRGYWVVTAIVSVSFWGVELLLQLVASPLGTRRYLRGGFLLDAGMIASDVTSIIMEGTLLDSPAGLKLLRLGKLARLLRIIGLLRLLRIVSVMKEYVNQMLSETKRMLVIVVSLLMGLLWATHISACAWFAVGSMASSDTGSHWLDYEIVINGENATFYDATPMYQYLTSLHWAMSQVCLSGSIDISCQNASERMLNVIWLTMGLIFGSVLVSNLSAHMVELYDRQRARDTQIRALRRYLQQNGVNLDVCARVIRQAGQRLATQEREAQPSVPALELLSMSLRTEVQANICGPVLFPHPLFRLWHSMDGVWFDRFCMEATRLVFFREGDQLFRPGLPAAEASVLVHGSVVYSRKPGSAPVDEAVSEDLYPGAWFCESVLWCEWLHVGTATCVSEIAKLLYLDPAKLWSICRGHRLIGGIALEYGRQYHRQVTLARPPFNEWPSDIHVPGTDFGDLVVGMPIACRKSIGLQAIRHCCNYTASRTWKRAVMPEALQVQLMDELAEGVATIVFDSAGKLVRMVSVVVLQVMKEDGCILMRLGKYDGYEVTATCELPGTKRRDQEGAEGALRRLLTTTLAPFANMLDFDQMTSSKVDRLSGKFDVLTNYERTVCPAVLRGFDCFPEGVHILHGGRRRSQVDSAPHRLLQGRVFFIPYGAKGTYYAWLSPADAEVLQKPSMHGQLEAMLMQLRLPSDMISREVSGDTQNTPQPATASGTQTPGETVANVEEAQVVEIQTARL